MESIINGTNYTDLRRINCANGCALHFLKVPPTETGPLPWPSEQQIRSGMFRTLIR